MYLILCILFIYLFLGNIDLVWSFLLSWNQLFTVCWCIIIIYLLFIYIQFEAPDILRVKNKTIVSYSNK